MSAAVLYGLVILSAIANSVWNAMMKSAGDRTMTMVAIRVVGLALGLIALPFVDWPSAAGWKWLALTALVSFGYKPWRIGSNALANMTVFYRLRREWAP